MLDVAAGTLFSRPNSVSVPRVVARGNVDEPATVNECFRWNSYNKFNLFVLPLYLGSVDRIRLYVSADMHVHCGSLDRDGLAGVLSGFRLALIFPLPGGSNFSE